MSHESDYTLIGRLASGEKLYVKASFQHPGGALWKTDIHHNKTTERLRLRLQGVVISKYGNLENDNSWRSCGQVTEKLQQLQRLESGWTVQDVVKLAEIWDEWHLNDMQAACAHQTQGADSPPCPITGYKWGHEWLIKSLPYKVFEWISDHFEIEPPAPGTTTI